MGEWRSARLGEVVELKRGYDLPTAKRKPGFVPIISSSGPSGLHDEAKVAGPGVVTGRYGTIGQVFYVLGDFWPLNTALYVRDFKGHSPRFIYYFLQGIDWESLNDKSGVPGVNRNHAHEALVSVPPTSVQDAIADLLGALDDKIELNRRMNETLEAMARAIFKDWFVDFGPTRAKAEGRAPYLAPEIWDLFSDALDDEDKPVGWTAEAVHDQALWVNGAAYKNMHFTDAAGSLPVIKIAELKAGVTKSTKFTNTALGDKYRISDGELLFSWSGNPDTSIDTFIWTGGDAWLNQHIFAVRQNATKSNSFLYAMLKWLKPEFAEIARNKQTTGLGHVTKQDLKRLTIHTGTPEILAAFDEVADPIYALIYSNLLENSRLTQTRDLLLPKLMSGEIRLAEAENA